MSLTVGKLKIIALLTENPVRRKIYPGKKILKCVNS
jgi:hypothetical protein